MMCGQGEVTAEDLCFSLQETVFGMLVEITGASPQPARLLPCLMLSCLVAISLADDAAQSVPWRTATRRTC
jgi:hypothetical protein